MERFIFHCEPDDFILAGRSIKFLLRDGYDDCVYAFEDGSHFWVKRNEKSITVRRIVGPHD